MGQLSKLASWICCPCGADAPAPQSRSVSASVSAPAAEPEASLETAPSAAVVLLADEASVDKEAAETLEWLNFIIVHMWPHIAKYAEETIRSMEATIQAAVPVSIHFKTVSLGKKPMRLGPIKPREVSGFYNDTYMEKGGIALDVGFSYDSDVDISLATSFGATIGVADLKINGVLSLILRPLVDTIPFIGAAEALFTNPPDVNLDFKGVGNLADMPGIYGIVRQVIDDAIAGICVTPNRIAVPISEDPNVDLARIKNPTPDCILRIAITKAENLEAKDFKLVGKATSDPYVRVKCGADTWKTPTIMKNLNPVWTEDNVHDFIVYSTEQLLQFDVFDYDKFDSDDPLGSINQISAKDLAAFSGQGPVPMQLVERYGTKQSNNKHEKGPADNCRLFVAVDWLWISPLEGTELPGSATDNKYVLQLKIDEVCNLPEKGLFPPFTVKVSIKDHAELSVSTKEPGWPKPGEIVTIDTLHRVRKLASRNLEPAFISDVMGIDVELIQELLQSTSGGQLKPISEEGSPSALDLKELEDEDAKWIEKIRLHHASRACCTNPQFEEVLMLPLPAKNVVAVIELFGDPVSSNKGSTRRGSAPPPAVASFELTLGDRHVIEGPWALSGDGVSGAELHGSMMLSRLEKANHLTKIRAAGWLFGQAAAAKHHHKKPQTVPSETMHQPLSPASTDQSQGERPRNTDSFAESVNSTMTEGTRLRKRDALKRLVQEGKNVRGAPDDKYRWGDGARGLVASVTKPKSGATSSFQPNVPGAGDDT